MSGRVRLQTGTEPFRHFALDASNVLLVDTREETAVVHMHPSGVEDTDRVRFLRTGATGDFIFKMDGVDVAKLPAPHAAWLEMRLDGKGGVESFTTGDGALWSDAMLEIIAKREAPEQELGGFVCDRGICDVTTLL